MLKKILIFLLTLIFLLDIVSGVSIEFLKDEYISRDTVQVEIDVSDLILIEPLTYSNIKLYGDNKIPIGLNLYKLKDKYFVFFNLPDLEAGNYNFVLEDLFYSEKNVLKKESFSKNLTVIDGKGISILPGLIYLNIEGWVNPRIGLEIKNKADEDIILSFDPASENIIFNTEDYLLKQGKNYFLSMVLDMRSYAGDEFNSELNINYLNTSYKVPIIVNKISSNVLSEGGEVSEIVEIGDIRFVEEYNKVERVLRKDDIAEGPLKFKNFGDKTLYNLKFILTSDLSGIVRFEYIGDYILEGGEEESIYIYINENKNIAKNYTGELIIRADDLEISFPFVIDYKPEEIVEIVNETEVEVYDYVYTPVNYTEPSYVEEEKSKVWLFVLLGIFFVVLLYLIYYFYKKGKPETKKFESLIPTLKKK